ncbi:MAG: GNAT family N-acetyltransferase [Silvibacterium sp.]|nr:GNAT family N-acetyltransferase [Silvibacterium sp.]MBV8438426.1 GNAT family N-acetyltransferase [Silvibacterium sp.]
MTGLPVSLFANPILHALQTKHRHFTVSAGKARRYPADVAPFVAVEEPTFDALQSLHSLLVPGEQVWIADAKFPDWPDIVWETSLECLQMVLPDDVSVPDLEMHFDTLSCSDAPAMVALTDLAFPGFFRIRTCEMGRYYGVHSNGELVSMSGERITFDGYPEVSGVCTHPAHRGKGYASALMWQVIRDHRREGLVSWLHVSAGNAHAIELYRRMGFIEARRILWHRISRRD